jgi:hypothetical protein
VHHRFALKNHPLGETLPQKQALTYRHAVLNLVTKYAPHLAPRIQKILKKHEGQEQKLFAGLKRRFGVDNAAAESLVVEASRNVSQRQNNMKRGGVGPYPYAWTGDGCTSDNQPGSGSEKVGFTRQSAAFQESFYQESGKAWDRPSPAYERYQKKRDRGNGADKVGFTKRSAEQQENSYQKEGSYLDYKSQPKPTEDRERLMNQLATLRAGSNAGNPPPWAGEQMQTRVRSSAMKGWNNASIAGHFVMSPDAKLSAWG